MNITEKTDDEILAIANPLWSHLVHASNIGQYGEFVKHFAESLVLGLNEIEVGKQFANSELTRNLSESIEFIGTIRRGEHVTVLYRQRIFCSFGPRVCRRGPAGVCNSRIAWVRVY